MVVAGVVILTAPSSAEKVLEELKQYPEVTTYGIHKKNYIVAVFEGESTQQVSRLTETLPQEIPGILGIYPSYINFEDEVNQMMNQAN